MDDAGAGFSSLRHILELAPDIIKLDINIVRNIDTEPSHRALASALVGFASETGSDLVAEGVETADEARTLSTLGVPLIQGYFAARPGPDPRSLRHPARGRRRTSLANGVAVVRRRAHWKHTTVMPTHHAMATAALLPIGVPISSPRRVSMMGVKG